jgi:serine/threonine-protein kinase
MAVVYRAHDPRLDRRVALKILAPELASDEEFRQRFLRESRAAAAVDHPNIIPIYEAGEADGVLFIAMRFVDGRDVQPTVDGEPSGLTCRIYRRRDGRTSPLPDPEDLRDALRAAAVR